MPARHINRTTGETTKSQEPIKSVTKDREIMIGGPEATDAPVIRYKLPKKMTPMQGADNGFHFGKPLGGGKWLNHHSFVTGAETGKTVTARLEIWDRIMDNGVTRHANIDLTDAEEGAAPTHELKCYFDKSQVPAELPADAKVFDLYNGGGKLVLVPISTK